MRAFLGLGSNAGDRLAHLRAAREELERRGLVVVAESSVYETEPQGEITNQPDFLNCCLAVETELAPEALLELCKAAERVLGRDPSGMRHGPRPIDVDLLLLDDVKLDTERLTLPHRDIASRRFVLVPLLEIEPALTSPDGSRLEEMLERLQGQRVVKVGPL